MLLEVSPRFRKGQCVSKRSVSLAIGGREEPIAASRSTSAAQERSASLLSRDNPASSGLTKDCCLREIASQASWQTVSSGSIDQWRETRWVIHHDRDALPTVPIGSDWNLVCSCVTQTQLFYYLNRIPVPVVGLVSRATRSSRM